jgi:hypothetical protein
MRVLTFNAIVISSSAKEYQKGGGETFGGDIEMYVLMKYRNNDGSAQ